MLIGFSFSNFMSFQENNVFSMRASSDNEFRAFNTIKIDYGDLLKSAIVFGANASGKTNMIKALDFMREILLSDPISQSHLFAKKNYFLFADNTVNMPRAFEVEFIQDGIILTYGFELLNKEVHKEYLYKKTKRKTPLFFRSSPDPNDINISKDMDNVKKFIENTRRDHLFLHWAILGNNLFARKVENWFTNLVISCASDTKQISTLDYLESSKDSKNSVLELLQKADINLLDFDVIKQKENSEDNLKIDLITSRYSFNSQKAPVDTIKLSNTQESEGLKKVFEMAGPLLEALGKGKVIFIDEIDTKLHPLLVKYLVMMFNSISKNLNNAQLICNTHNTLLLDEDIRRDQFYFIEKDEYGASSLFSLADIKGVRKDSNFMKQYLLGVFGAIPTLRKSYISKKFKLGRVSNE